MIFSNFKLIPKFLIVPDVFFLQFINSEKSHQLLLSLSKATQSLIFRFHNIICSTQKSQAGVGRGALALAHALQLVQVGRDGALDAPVGRRARLDAGQQRLLVAKQRRLGTAAHGVLGAQHERLTVGWQPGKYYGSLGVFT